jgi:hypothetical protein
MDKKVAETIQTFLWKPLFGRQKPPNVLFDEAATTQS